MMHRCTLAAAILAVLLPAAAGGEAEPPEAARDRVFYTRGEGGWVKYPVARRMPGGAKIAAVEVWYRRDGGEWTRYGEDRKLGAGRMMFKAEQEGEYQIAAVAVDAKGGREFDIGEKTPVSFRLVVDRTAPEVTARREAPAEGAAPPAAGATEFSWAAKDRWLGAKPVELEARLGKQGEWRTVQTGLAAEGKAAFPGLEEFAKRLTDGEVQVRFVARDLAGNSGAAEAGGITVDRLPPEGRVTGPTVAMSSEVAVSYEVEDRGSSGLAEAALWVSADAGRSWKLSAEKLALGRGSVRIRTEGGKPLGLFLYARDRAGNELGPPGPGTRPQLTMLRDGAPPRLQVLEPEALEGRVFSAAKDAPPIVLSWKLFDENLPKGALTVEFSSDGGDTWTILAKSLDNAPDEHTGRPTDRGSCELRPPKVESQRCVLRLSAADEMGNKAVVVTRPFSVDDRPPSRAATFEPVEEPVRAPAQPEPGPEKPPVPKMEPPAAAGKRPLDEARALLAAGRSEAAAAKAREALEADPKSAPAHALLGRALMGGDWPGALEHLDAAAKGLADATVLHADLAKASFELGKLRGEQDRRAESEKLLHRAVDLYDRIRARSPDSAVAHYNLAQALVYLSWSQDEPGDARRLAEKQFGKAMELGREDRNLCANSCWWLAEIKESSGERRAAVELWRKAAGLYGRDTELGRRALARAEAARRRR